MYQLGLTPYTYHDTVSKPRATVRGRRVTLRIHVIRVQLACLVERKVGGQSCPRCCKPTGVSLNTIPFAFYGVRLDEHTQQLKLIKMKMLSMWFELQHNACQRWRTFPCHPVCGAVVVNQGGVERGHRRVRRVVYLNNQAYMKQSCIFFIEEFEFETQHGKVPGAEHITNQVLGTF